MNHGHKHLLFFILFCVIPLYVLAQGEESENPKMYTFVKSDKKYIISINNNVDLVEALSQFCTDQNIRSGIISGLGTAKEVTLRYVDSDNKRYTDKSVYEQVTIANLTGNISQYKDEACLHIHATVGRSDYRMEAGQLVSAVVSGMLECVVEELDVVLQSRFCSEKTMTASRLK